MRVQSLLPLRSAFIFGICLALMACDDDKSYEARAMARFNEYCSQEGISCTSSMLEDKKLESNSAYFQFVITEKPEHFVTIKVYRDGGIEVSRWKERND